MCKSCFYSMTVQGEHFPMKIKNAYIQNRHLWCKCLSAVKVRDNCVCLIQDWIWVIHCAFPVTAMSFFLWCFRKRRYHSRRIHRDVIKKRTLIGDDVGLTPPYKHRHSGNGCQYVNPVRTQLANGGLGIALISPSSDPCSAWKRSPALCLSRLLR